MGNIKEAVIPYFKKEIKLAKMSFDLYGAVSPSEEIATNKKDDDADIAADNNEVKKERIVTQVELESSAPPVRLFSHFSVKSISRKNFVKMRFHGKKFHFNFSVFCNDPLHILVRGDL